MEILDFLEAFNTVFASLFYLIGVIMFVVIIVAVTKIKNQIVQTAEMTQDAIYSVHELVTDVVQTTFASSIINRIAAFFGKK